MNTQKEFAVPKDSQDVTVILGSGKAVEGMIFLEYAPETQTVHHRVVAFLEDGNFFFPLKLKGSDGTEFINKMNIKLIELVNNSIDQDKINPLLSLMHTENMTIIFNDETMLSGALMADVPDEKTRLSDCLNLPARFINVKTGSKICYINKNAIRKVVYGRKA